MLNRDRKLLGRMDTQITIVEVATTTTATGGPTQTKTDRGPYWAAVNYLTRKQGEVEISSRITSFQQISFIVRYSSTVEGYLSKAGYLKIVGSSDEYNIITISLDKGRKQYIEIITELKQ